MNRFNRFMTPRLIQPLMMASAPMMPPPGGGAGGETGGESGGAGNNSGGGSGGNSGSETNDSGGSNNSGQDFDGSSFWDEPAGNDTQAGGSQGASGDKIVTDDEFKTQLGNQLQNMSFGGEVVTDKIKAELAEGNYTGLNEAMVNHGKQVVQQALSMVVPILQRFGAQMAADFNSKVEGRFQGKDTESMLGREFKGLYEDAKTRPIVEQVFGQAMKHNKNDRAKAIGMTRDMLRIMGTTITGQGENLGIPAQTPGDNGGVKFTNDWMDRLVGKSG